MSLNGGIGLPRAEAIGGVDLPASQQAPRQALLFVIEGQFVHHGYASDVGEVNAGWATFAAITVKRILWVVGSVSAGSGAEDFASVVEGPAISIGSSRGQPMPATNSQFRLQTVVF